MDETPANGSEETNRQPDGFITGVAVGVVTGR